VLIRELSRVMATIYCFTAIVTLTLRCHLNVLILVLVLVFVLVLVTVLGLICLREFCLLHQGPVRGREEILIVCRWQVRTVFIERIYRALAQGFS